MVWGDPLDREGTALERPLSQSPEAPPLQHHLMGLAAALGAFFFLCAGTPGARMVGPSVLEPEGRAKVRANAGAFAPVLFALYEANFAVRTPVARHLTPIQSVFRISQAWGLYGAGPKVVRRLRIDIDGAPVYRTEDPQLRWRAPQLRHRKVRPMVETMATKANAYNWTGFSRWVRDEALKDFPNAQQITILAEWSDRSPNAQPTVHHLRHAVAPAWSWQSYDADGREVELAAGDNP